MEKKNARCDPLLREKGIVKGQHNPVLRRKDPMRSRRRWRFAKKEEVEAAWRSSPSPPQLLHSFRTLRTDSNHGFKLELPDLEEISDPPSGRNEKLK